MGYVAYAVGTLIAAVAIHSFYKTRLSVSRDKEDSDDVNAAAPEIVVSQSKHDSKATEPTATPPLLATEATPPDNAQQQENDPSGAAGEGYRSDTSLQRSSHATQSGEQQVAAQGASQTQSPSQAPSQNMPPPARPSSASLTTNSAAAQARQRAAMPPPSSLPPSRARSPPRLKPATASLAPPPRPGRPPQGGTTSLAPPSTASTLGVPTQKVLANTKMQPSLAPSTSTLAPTKRSSKKVMLAPGHSPLDWAALTRSTSPTAPTKLRGSDATAHLGPHRLGRVTPSQLKHQNGRKGKDAWTVYQGKVYNISAYLDFHPGGRDELMKGAGRASDGLFAEVHPWVNWDGMLQGCLVGMLVGEHDAAAAATAATAVGGAREQVQNDLDEMD